MIASLILAAVLVLSLGVALVVSPGFRSDMSELLRLSVHGLLWLVRMAVILAVCVVLMAIPIVGWVVLALLIGRGLFGRAYQVHREHRIIDAATAIKLAEQGVFIPSDPNDAYAAYVVRRRANLALLEAQSS